MSETATEAGPIDHRKVSSGAVMEETSETRTVPDALEVARASAERLSEICTELAEDDAQRKPGVGKLSAIEHVVHLLDMERDVFHVRFRRVLDEDAPQLASVSMEHLVEADRVESGDLAALVAEWLAERKVNLDLVAGTSEDQWDRVATQPDQGPLTFRELVHQWSRHDMDHLRQLEIIAMNSRERNL